MQSRTLIGQGRFVNDKGRFVCIQAHETCIRDKKSGSLARRFSLTAKLTIESLQPKNAVNETRKWAGGGGGLRIA